MGFQNINKKGFSITGSFYAILVAGIVLTAVGVIFSSVGSFYGSSVPYDLEQYGVNDNVSSIVSDYEQRLSPETANPNTDFEATTFTGGFGIINTLIGSFRVVFGSSGLISAVAYRIGIPSFITQGIVAMIIVTLVFAIVGIIFRLGRQP